MRGISDRIRRESARLVEAMGLDPGRVVEVAIDPLRPRVARVTILDGPTPADRHVEEHEVPEGWEWAPPITLGDLGANNVGERVTITTPDATITGTLRGISVETDWIDVRRLTQAPGEGTEVPGRKSVSVTVGRWRATGLPLDAAVEVG